MEVARSFLDPAAEELRSCSYIIGVVREQCFQAAWFCGTVAASAILQHSNTEPEARVLDIGRRHSGILRDSDARDGGIEVHMREKLTVSAANPPGPDLSATKQRLKNSLSLGDLDPLIQRRQIPVDSVCAFEQYAYC